MSQASRSLPVMVLGDSLAARVALEELRHLGYPTQWVGEQNPRPAAAEQAYSGQQFIALQGQVGSFQVHLDGPAGAQTVQTAAIIVATGNERHTALPSNIGPGEHRVLTVSRLRERIEAPRTSGQVMEHVHQRLLLVLDWQHETPRQTAYELLEAAQSARERWRCEVYVFYRDLIVDAPGIEALTRDLREAGIVFCRYGAGPDCPTPALSADMDGVSFSFDEGQVSGDSFAFPDDVAPRSDTAALAQALNIRLGEDGYLQDVNIRHYRPGISSRRGVFLAGRCHADQSDTAAHDDALQAVANVDALLGSGRITRNPVIARVDIEKCVRCLTCERSCPHAAILVEVADQDVLAAHVLELACEGCGTCISNCPVRAISFVDQPIPTWMA